MSQYNKPSFYTPGVAGITVARPATTLVQNTEVDLYSISGGLILVTGLVGVVTTAIPNTASLTVKLTYTPTGGSVADLTAATGITDDAVGTLYSWSYVDGDELISQLTPAGTEVPSVNFAPALSPGAYLRAGVIGITVSNHDPTTGAIKWFMTYVPIETGASVALA